MKSRVIQPGAGPPAPDDRALSTPDERPPPRVRHHPRTVSTFIKWIAEVTGRGARRSRG